MFAFCFIIEWFKDYESFRVISQCKKYIDFICSVNSGRGQREDWRHTRRVWQTAKTHLTDTSASFHAGKKLCNFELKSRQMYFDSRAKLGTAMSSSLVLCFILCKNEICWKELKKIDMKYQMEKSLLTRISKCHCDRHTAGVSSYQILAMSVNEKWENLISMKIKIIFFCQS